MAVSKLVTLQTLKQAVERMHAEFGELGGALYGGVKRDLLVSDSEIIEAYFGQDGAPSPKTGDVFIVTTIVDEKEYEKSAYGYDGEQWVAMTGNVDADKVILRKDYTLAGNYEQVGNWTKSRNGTVKKATSGMSVAAMLDEILSQVLQPSITAQPSITGFALSGAGAVEAGTRIASPSYSAGTLHPGTYSFGPKSGTGVVASHWKVERITNKGASAVTEADTATLAAGSDSNGGTAFIIGDSGEDNAVSSLKYRVTATHGAGVQAEDNLGGASSPAVAIAAGTKTKDTSAYTPYRNYFYGATVGKPTLDSAYIRGLTKSNKAYSAGTITLNVPAGANRVAIACMADKPGVKKIINETALNADVTDTFVKQTAAVEGANGYTAKGYNVWVFEPAIPYENAAVLKVTLG